MTALEPFDKLLRYGQTLDFLDPTAVGSSMFFEDIGEAVSQLDGLDGVLARLDQLLREHRPAIVVIGNFKALQPFAIDAAGYRRFLHDLAGRFSALALSSFLLGEYPRGAWRRTRVRGDRRDRVARS